MPKSEHTSRTKGGVLTNICTLATIQPMNIAASTMWIVVRAQSRLAVSVCLPSASLTTAYLRMTQAPTRRFYDVSLRPPKRPALATPAITRSQNPYRKAIGGTHHASDIHQHTVSVFSALRPIGQRTQAAIVPPLVEIPLDSMSEEQRARMAPIKLAQCYVSRYAAGQLRNQ